VPPGEFAKKRKGKLGEDDCGCDAAHGTEAGDYAADDEVIGAFAAAEAEADLAPDPRGNTVRRWEGLLAPIGVPTGDGRRFAANALSSRDLPLPVAWPRVDEGGHKSAVTVGRIDGINYGKDGEVTGWGIIFDPDPEKLPRLKQDADEAWFLLGKQTLGPSVDLDDMEFHPLGDEFAQDGKQEIEVTKGRISRITLVPIPAFSEARPFALSDLDADAYAELTAVTAAGVAQGMEDLEVADDVEWDPVAHLEDVGHLAASALYSRRTGPGLDEFEHLFPVAKVLGGHLYLVPGAVADAVSVLAHHGDDLNVPPGAQQAMRHELESLTAACGLPTPPWAQAALVAAAGLAPAAPSTALFADPKLAEPTPVRIEKTADGHLRYYGHVATWGVCHIGFPGKCVTAPRSRSKYAYFHTGSTDTADKGRIKTGRVTLGGGHADTSLGFQAALGHYDETGWAVADVRAGEDHHGIWVSGVVRPGVDLGKLSELAAAPLSGDWRNIGGGLEMVAALAVNTPGFPVVNVRRHAGQDIALVAAGAIAPEAPQASVAELSVREVVQAELSRERRAQRAARAFAVAAQQRVQEAAAVFTDDGGAFGLLDRLKHMHGADGKFIGKGGSSTGAEHVRSMVKKISSMTPEQLDAARMHVSMTRSRSQDDENARAFLHELLNTEHRRRQKAGR
jgi:hypothetical protein